MSPAGLLRAAARVIDFALPAAGLGWLAGRALGDASVWAQGLHYLPGLPLSLLLALWLGLRPSAGPGRRRLAAGCALLMVAEVLVAEVRWTRPPGPQPGDLKFVHWNIARGARGIDGVLATLARDQPDLLALSELPREEDFPARVRQHTGLPHVQVVQGLLLAARTPIVVRERKVPLENARGWAADVEGPGGGLRLLLVDVPSRPDLERRVMAESIARWVDRQEPGRRLLVVGDFNTPRRAPSLRPLRERLQPAWQSAGTGWPFSWPLPLPCYGLDQLWCGRDLAVHEHRYRLSWSSDHLRQVAWLAGTGDQGQP